ncbi:MAG: hypothetical protein JWN29_1014, partial [Acidimicrobiales bacterium]|nr:hypothetical protein [Acidimicrobiales bacterium]
TRHRLRLVPVAAVLLVLFVVTLFCPFRAGQQVLAGLDHNFVVDAWGGPSYLGAALAHWLDLALLFYGLTGLMAWLGGRVLSAPRDRATAAGPPS